MSNLLGNQSDLTSPITDETLTLLRVIAAEWSKRSPELKIDEDALRDIHAEAHRLFETVKRADIDLDLKRLILVLISEIEHAIQHYRIAGPDAIERAQSFILGQIHLKLEIINKAKADERTGVWWTRFHKVTVKFFDVLRLANDTRKTIEAVSPLVRLLGAPDEIPPVDIDDPDKQ